jgi:protein SCO1/2
MSNPRKPLSHTRLITIIVGLIILMMATAVYTITRHNYAAGQHVKVDGLYITPAQEIKDFALTDTSESPYGKQNLRGHWTMMFFGFTNCGMVCPLTMTALKQMYATLEKDLPAAELPDIVMVSVDPERDSLDRMKEYVTEFNPRFRGARAEMPEIEALEKQLHLVSIKLKADGQGPGHYTINHSAEIMVFNPDGKLQAFLAYPHVAEQMADDYRTIIRNAKRA